MYDDDDVHNLEERIVSSVGRCLSLLLQGLGRALKLTIYLLLKFEGDFGDQAFCNIVTNTRLSLVRMVFKTQATGLVCWGTARPRALGGLRFDFYWWKICHLSEPRPQQGEPWEGDSVDRQLVSDGILKHLFCLLSYLVRRRVGSLQASLIHSLLPNLFHLFISSCSSTS